MKKNLDVFLNAYRIGELVLADDQMSFAYSPAWLSSHGAYPLSRSLPLTGEPFSQARCLGYFAGLLPEGYVRARIASSLGVSEENHFGLLEKLGGECAGAVSVLPPGRTPRFARGEYRELAPADLRRMMARSPDFPMVTSAAGSRLSLAGAQDKLAVLADGDKIFLPVDGAPSTHILKPMPPHFDGLVANELACSKLAALAGLPAAVSEKRSAGMLDYLLVQRYDRMVVREGGRIHVTRLHQEDFCQALGIPPGKKYQSEGGPSLAQCFELVSLASSNPKDDANTLLDAVCFNFLIGNGDAHGKNFSLVSSVSDTGRVTRLAPLYDLVCTSVYTELDRHMAMTIGGKSVFNEITPVQFDQMAESVGFSSRSVRDKLLNMAERIRSTMPSAQPPPALAKIVTQRCEHVLRTWGPDTLTEHQKRFDSAQQVDGGKSIRSLRPPT